MKVKPTYSAAEIARMLHMSKATVGRWIRDGQLPTVEVGPKKRVPIAALQKAKSLWESILLAEQINKQLRARAA